MNYCWWLNRKDADGNNVFEGGFLGLDNISVYDRSQPLPPATASSRPTRLGMAMFALNMTMMFELTASDSDYEDVAIQCTSSSGHCQDRCRRHRHRVSLWDEPTAFQDVVVGRWRAQISTCSRGWA
jgi:hypothetical protein